jgi:hypothetical protein
MAQLTVLRERLHQTLDPAELRERLAERARTTPGRLNLYLIVLIALGLLAGVAAVVGVVQRSDAVDAVATRSGPLAITAQGLYRSLSDADATAAAAFLTVAEPPRIRQRYLDDITAASSALASTSVTSDAERGPLARIATALPVYTGLVETARTQNRLNLPVGAAYLREASALMRATLLPAASDLYQVETVRLADERSRAAGFPWLTIPVIVLTLAGLVVAQLYLVRRTRRLINVGVAVATGIGLVLLIWVTASWVGVASNLAAADRNGSAQVQAMARARIAALQARADEALTLVARGSGGAFEDDFRARMADLVGADGRGGMLSAAQDDATDPTVSAALASARDAAVRWRSGHQRVRSLDDSGQYTDAVALAVGAVSTSFAGVDDELQKAIAAAGAEFDERARIASDALAGAVVVWPLLTLGLLAGLAVGLEQRIGEYR